MYKDLNDNVLGRLYLFIELKCILCCNILSIKILKTETHATFWWRRLSKDNFELSWVEVDLRVECFDAELQLQEPSGGSLIFGTMQYMW